MNTINDKPKIGMRIKKIQDAPKIEHNNFRWLGTWMQVQVMGVGNFYELVGDTWQCATCGLVKREPFNHNCKTNKNE